MEMALEVALEELQQRVTLNGDHHGCRRDQGSIVDDHTLRKAFLDQALTNRRAS